METLEGLESRQAVCFSEGYRRAGKIKRVQRSILGYAVGFVVALRLVAGGR